MIDFIAGWALKALREEQLARRVNLSRELLRKIEANETGFFDRIITGDETWIYQYDPESTFAEERTTLLRFRAGKMWLENNRMHVDYRKGWFCLFESEGFVYHCWKDRRTGILEDEKLLVPEEALFVQVPQCKTGRAYALKFLLTGKRLFFWMQARYNEILPSFRFQKDEYTISVLSEKDATKDAGLCKKVNEILKYEYQVQKRRHFGDMIHDGRVSPSRRTNTPTSESAKLKHVWDPNQTKNSVHTIGTDDSENYDLDEEEDEKITTDENQTGGGITGEKEKEHLTSNRNVSPTSKQPRPQSRERMNHSNRISRTKDSSNRQASSRDENTNEKVSTKRKTSSQHEKKKIQVRSNKRSSLRCQKNNERKMQTSESSDPNGSKMLKNESRKQRQRKMESNNSSGAKDKGFCEKNKK
ncbi:hypothetical protein M514_01940 [Trichuris suis]|uniref:Pru domain-containing protein n=1 Tax=Trichuris suis TaxID=68888 RepID=A0A085NJC8_9BILA|nr:hypothetical protein M514_01940 [Trichuris suis]